MYIGVNQINLDSIKFNSIKSLNIMMRANKKYMQHFLLFQLVIMSNILSYISSFFFTKQTQDSTCSSTDKSINEQLDIPINY